MIWVWFARLLFTVSNNYTTQKQTFSFCRFQLRDINRFTSSLIRNSIQLHSQLSLLFLPIFPLKLVWQNMINSHAFSTKYNRDNCWVFNVTLNSFPDIHLLKIKERHKAHIWQENPRGSIHILDTTVEMAAGYPQVRHHATYIQKKTPILLKIALTLCFNRRSTNGRRTWWRRFMIRRFSSSDSRA